MNKVCETRLLFVSIVPFWNIFNKSGIDDISLNEWDIQIYNALATDVGHVWIQDCRFLSNHEMIHIPAINYNFRTNLKIKELTNKRKWGGKM